MHSINFLLLIRSSNAYWFSNLVSVAVFMFFSFLLKEMHFYVYLNNNKKYNSINVLVCIDCVNGVGRSWASSMITRERKWRRRRKKTHCNRSWHQTRHFRLCIWNRSLFNNEETAFSFFQWECAATEVDHFQKWEKEIIKCTIGDEMKSNMLQFVVQTQYTHIHVYTWKKRLL